MVLYQIRITAECLGSHARFDDMGKPMVEELADGLFLADDRTPSLSLKDEHGKILVYCHAGCEQDAVVGALNPRIIDLQLDTLCLSK